MKTKNKHQKSGPGSLLTLFCIVFLAILVIPGIVGADDYVGGLPLTTVKTGTVTGDLYISGNPPSSTFSYVVDRTFTLPAAAVATPGQVKWARLYISSYCGHMEDAKAITYTTKVDWNNDGMYDNTWTESDNQIYYFVNGNGNYGGNGNDNSEFAGHTTGEPYLMVNDHTTRVTSDYLSWYDVTNMIQTGQSTIKVNVDATGSYDGRIKVVELVVAYDDSSSTTQTIYWVNEGQDATSYYTEDLGTVAVGSTTFGTAAGLVGITTINSATLITDYMASNNGQYGFPTAANDFDASGGYGHATGGFTNIALDRIADVQGPYSGKDSWDVTSSVSSSSDVTLGYSRYLPATGNGAFYKIPLAFLVVKSPKPVTAPVAAFAADIVSGTAPLTVTFTDQSTNSPTSWAWTFGDGATSDQQSPVHQYTAAGTYTVTLTTTNAGGSSIETKTDYITVNAAPAIDLTISGLVNTVPASAIFAKEPNAVVVNNVRNTGTGTATNIVLKVYASDVDSGSTAIAETTIASLAGGAQTTLNLVDPTIRTIEGGTVTYTAKVDPDNLIAETNEANNNKAGAAKSLKYNGYKGKGDYWEGGSDITTKLTYDLNGDIVYFTQPESAYKGVGWTTRTETWTAANLPVPAGATVVKAWLYIDYNWDQTYGGYPSFVATFNGNTLTPGTPYRDWSNFGTYADYEYGLYPAIDVTPVFNKNGDNTLVMTPNADNVNALYPSTLVVIYSDASATRKQIFINEECDELGVSDSSYGTTLAEATAYAPFSGMTIDTANVQSATLHSFAGSAGPGEGNLLFNGVTVATNAWMGTANTASAQSFDVKSHLTATGNEAGIQGTTSGGMDALQQILVVEYIPATTYSDLSVTTLAINPGSASGHDVISANEANTLRATVANTGELAAGAFDVTIVIGAYTQTVNVVSLAAGATTAVDFTYAPTTTGAISIVTTADSGAVIAESNEANNALTTASTVYYNGYKGKRYTAGSDFTTVNTYTGRDGVVYSTGNAVYQSANWMSYSASFTAAPSSANLNIPSDATILSARLYQSTNFDQTTGAGALWTATFNSGPVTPTATYTDRKGYGSYNYPSEVYMYDVTSSFNKAGTNTWSLSSGSNLNVALYPTYIVVVYEDAATQTEKTIYINDECDLLWSRTTYNTNNAEATAYAPFTGVDITDMGSAKAIAFVAAVNEDGQSQFIFNNIDQDDFYISSTASTAQTVSIKEFTLTNVVSGANEAKFQSRDASDGDNMQAQNVILVVEKTAVTDQPAITFVPATQTFNPSETATYVIQMDKAPTGLAGYDMVVSLADGSIADITSVTYDSSWAQMPMTPTVPGDSIRIGAVDTQQKIYPGTTGPYTLATITVRGVGAGSTGIVISSVNMDDDSGVAITPTTNVGTAIIGSYAGPVASFTGTPVSGNAPLTVAFDSTASTGTITTYQWDFDNDGTIDSTAANPSHTYSGIGSYSVKLTVSGPGGSNTVLKNAYITVSDGTAPTATITATPITGNSPLSVAFSATTTGNVVSYAWDFGDGVHSTLAAPTHTYTYPGTFTASLVATGTGGSSAPATATIHATHNAPVAGIIATPTSGTVPLLVQFTDASTGTITAYDWDFGDGSAHDTTANPSHTYTSAGTFTVSHTVTGPGGVSTPSTTTITGNGLSVDFTASALTGVASAEHPLAVTFTSTVTPGATSHLWDFGDGTTSTDANPTHSYYGRLKSFTVTLTVHNGADVASKTRTSYISITPYLEAFPKYDSAGAVTGYYPQIPADLNGDYVYEDINHNGRVDYDDVVAFYGAFTYNWFTTNTDVDQVNFDYSGNGALGYQDVVALNDLVLY